jgi:2-methylisocitrate lyase-like PEP mutase family enzyme
MRPQATALKALLDEPRLQVMPGCGDGMGARLIEEAGFAPALSPARACRRCASRCRTWIW